MNIALNLHTLTATLAETATQAHEYATDPDASPESRKAWRLAFVAQVQLAARLLRDADTADGRVATLTALLHVIPAGLRGDEINLADVARMIGGHDLG